MGVPCESRHSAFLNKSVLSPHPGTGTPKTRIAFGTGCDVRETTLKLQGRGVGAWVFHSCPQTWGSPRCREGCGALLCDFGQVSTSLCLRILTCKLRQHISGTVQGLSWMLGSRQHTKHVRAMPLGSECGFRGERRESLQMNKTGVLRERQQSDVPVLARVGG